MKLKVIITGGTGLLASNIAVYKRDAWNILLLTRSHMLSMEGVSTAKANLIDLNWTSKIFETFKPDLVIHTAGLTNVDACEACYHEAHLANTVAAKNVAKLCLMHGSKMVHISTDHFANELLEFSTENDISLPVNVYAQTKLQAESEVLRHNPEALILRTNFFAWGHSTRTSFSDFIIDNLRKKQNITLYDDVFYTPILSDDLVDALEGLYLKKASGVFNVVSSEKLSKYQFGIELAREFELDTDLIKKGSLPTQNTIRRPRNMALSNKKLIQTLGFDFDLRKSLERLKNLEFDGRRKKLIAAVQSTTLSKPILYYSKQNIDDSDVESVTSSLLSAHLTQGPLVQEFEERISRYNESKYTVSFSNLTCALHAAYVAMGIGPGDYIITSPISFVATANAAVFCGAKPIFVDIDSKSLNLDPAQLEKVIINHPERSRIKAIVPVHFSGNPCDMEAIVRVAQKFNLKVFEDAAHAIGGSYLNSKKIGPYKGSLGAGFSFHPVKNITTGEGAAISTNDAGFYQELCRLRSHGINKGNDPFIKNDLAFTEGKLNSWYYEMQALGFNYRLTDIQCSLGMSQLNRLNEFTSKKTQIAQIYDQNLKDLPHVTLLQDSTRTCSGNHLYVTCIDFKSLGISRRVFFEKMLADGISLHVHYIPIFYQPFYEDLANVDYSQMKNTIHYYEGAATLPLHPGLTEAQVTHVVKSLKQNLVST